MFKKHILVINKKHCSAHCCRMLNTLLKYFLFPYHGFYLNQRKRKKASCRLNKKWNYSNFVHFLCYFKVQDLCVVALNLPKIKSNLSHFAWRRIIYLLFKKVLRCWVIITILHYYILKTKNTPIANLCFFVLYTFPFFNTNNNNCPCWIVKMFRGGKVEKLTLNDKFVHDGHGGLWRPVGVLTDWAASRSSSPPILHRLLGSSLNKFWVQFSSKCSQFEETEREISWHDR